MLEISGMEPESHLIIWIAQNVRKKFPVKTALNCTRSWSKSKT